MESSSGDQRSRAPRSRRLGASSRSSPSSALTSEDRDRSHEAEASPSSSSQSQESQDQLSLVRSLSQLREDHSLTRDQNKVVDLFLAVVRDNIVKAKRLARELQGIDMDQAWGEVAQVCASKYKTQIKLPGPLHQAAANGDMPMCKLIITQCKCDVNAATIFDGRTPLIFASNLEGNEAIVKYLINNDADPNKADKSGITPLHMAATEGCYEIAEHLLSKGANVDPLCQAGESPLFCAALEGNEKIVRLLLDHNADYNRLSKERLSPLLASLHGSSLNCLKILIEAGADVNGAGCSDRPLALAATKGLVDCIQCLLTYGADPNLRDEYNDYPIQIAAFKGLERCVELLLPFPLDMTQYEGLSIPEIIQREKNDRYGRSIPVIAQGDDAYWRKEHGIALEFYKEAARIGHNDPALYAKKSLCHIYLRQTKEHAKEAIKYMNTVQPNLSTLDPENAAKKLLWGFLKIWTAARLDSGSSSTDKTDETSSGEHQ